jgi:hypothetical protein
MPHFFICMQFIMHTIIAEGCYNWMFEIKIEPEHIANIVSILWQ